MTKSTSCPGHAQALAVWAIVNDVQTAKFTVRIQFVGCSVDVACSGELDVLRTS